MLPLSLKQMLLKCLHYLFHTTHACNLNSMLTCLPCFFHFCLSHFKLMSMLMSHTPNFNSYINSRLSCMFVTSSPCTFQPHVYAHFSCLCLACLSHLTINHSTICFTNLYHLSCVFVTSSPCTFQAHAY